MKFGALILLLSTFLLSGCWSSETRLMPESEKVSLDLTGTYTLTPQARGEEVTIRSLSTFEFEVIEKNVNGVQGTYTGSLDRVDPEKYIQLSSWIYDDSALFIAEIVQGKAIFYTILVVNATESGQVRMVRQLKPLCSDSVRKVVGAIPNDLTECVFTRYSDVERATLDVIRWLQDDPRLVPSFEQYDRKL